MRKERKKREKKELAFLIQQKKSWSGTRYVFFYTYFVACCSLCSLATTTRQNWIFEPIQRLWCVSGDGGSCGGEMVVVRRVQVLVVVMYVYLYFSIYMSVTMFWFIHQHVKCFYIILTVVHVGYFTHLPRWQIRIEYRAYKKCCGGSSDGGDKFSDGVCV